MYSPGENDSPAAPRRWQVGRKLYHNESRDPSRKGRAAL